MKLRIVSKPFNGYMSPAAESADTDSTGTEKPKVAPSCCSCSCSSCCDIEINPMDF